MPPEDALHIDEAVRAIRARGVAPPRTAIVLGSGLGEVAGRLRDPVSIEYESLPHWPRATVAGHEGRLVIGRLAGTCVAALAGRTHLYEGRPPSDVVFGTRVMARLGVRAIVLTNAAGGINGSFEAGSLMIIDDHIGLLVANPLIGANDDRLGPRFPDMTEVYSPRLRSIAHDAAREIGVTVHRGIYAAVPGPSYETPAEIRYLRLIGADAVGMSTVPEAIAARHMGLEVLGVSCITNMAAGVLPHPLSHTEVLETAGQMRHRLFALLEAIVGRI